MRAWQFEGRGKPIALNEAPEPEPGPGEVVIDVRAAGLCHSDVMYMATGGRSMPFLPMTQGHETAGMKVGVIGYGGLGQVGTRAAVLTGAEVYVAEPKEDVWELAQAAGAAGVVKDAGAWAGQEFDLVVDYAGFDTTAKAVAAVKRGWGPSGGGTVVQVGLGQPTFTVPTNTILGRNLVGSLGGTVADIEEVYDLMLNKEIEPYYTKIAFEKIGDGLRRLGAGEVTGRLVARFGG